jgi:hypothetical protein
MKRFRIDRIDVDMRGVQPATVRAAARELGAAIQRQLATPADQVTRTRARAGTTPTGLADRVARQVAGRIGR